MSKKGLIALSGGLDSTTLLYYLLDKGYEIPLAVSVYYGSKHNEKEIEAAKYHTEKLGIKHIVLDLSYMKDLFKSSLLKGQEDVPEGYYTEENMKKTVVPFRNAIILSNLVGIAESEGLDNVFLASHSGDHAIYPDCRPEFNKSMYLAAYHGTFNHVKILFPFENFTKDEVVKIGLKLRVPYEHTWSCYKGGDRPCLKCGTCTERIEAFYLNKTKDPLLTDEEWKEGVSYLLENDLERFIS